MAWIRIVKMSLRHQALMRVLRVCCWVLLVVGIVSQLVSLIVFASFSPAAVEKKSYEITNFNTGLYRSRYGNIQTEIIQTNNQLKVSSRSSQLIMYFLFFIFIFYFLFLFYFIFIFLFFIFYFILFSFLKRGVIGVFLSALFFIVGSVLLKTFLSSPSVNKKQKSIAINVKKKNYFYFLFFYFIYIFIFFFFTFFFYILDYWFDCCNRTLLPLWFDTFHHFGYR